MKTRLREIIEILRAIEQGKPWQQFQKATGRWIDPPEWACPIAIMRRGYDIRLKPKITREELSLELLAKANELMPLWDTGVPAYHRLGDVIADIHHIIRRIDDDQ